MVMKVDARVAGYGPGRETALVTVTVEFDGPTESMTLSVIVPNEGDGEALRDRGEGG